VELISTFPLRSEWYCQLDDITLVKADVQNVLIARADGSSARFRFWNRDHDAVVAALVECGLPVKHVNKIADTEVRLDR
jgi:hypothetical protein